MNDTRVMCTALAAAVCLSVSAWAQNGAATGGHANALTAQEQKEGWILLFDGRSLDKWDVTPALAKVFKVGEGSIKVDLSDAGGTLLTKDDFANFVLKAEFRAHPDINSGIILRSPAPRPAPAAGEKPTPDPGGPGYELQIRDKVLTDRTGGEYLTGGIVNVAHSPEGTKIVPNQWNTFEATLTGDHIVVLYNGAKVVDVHDARRSTGAIGLQSAHPEDPAGAFVEFRSLRIKRLK